SDDVHAEPEPVLHLHDAAQLRQQLVRPVLGDAEHDLVVDDAAHVVSVAGLEHPNDRFSDDVAGGALDAVVAQGVAAVYEDLTTSDVGVPNVLDSCALLFCFYEFVVLFDALSDAWIGVVDAVAEFRRQLGADATLIDDRVDAST